MKSARTKVSISDYFVCIAVGLLAIVTIILPGKADGDSVLVSTENGSHTYDLSEDRTEILSSAGHTLTLEIKNSSVRISESDCPDGLCVSSGWVDDPSRIIVCAPAKVLVRIQNTGGDVSDADFIAGR